MTKCLFGAIAGDMIGSRHEWAACTDPHFSLFTKSSKFHDSDRSDLKFFLLVGNKPAAVKRVCELTGVGLRVSKDFVDSLQ